MRVAAVIMLAIWVADDVVGVIDYGFAAIGVGNATVVVVVASDVVAVVVWLLLLLSL